MNLAAIAQKALRATPGSLKATVRFTRLVPGAYDPATDTRTDDETQRFDVQGVLSSVQPDQLPGTSTDELTRFRDLTVAALDCAFVPSAKDTTALINGETWRVVSADPVDPSGAAPAVFTVRLHR